MIWSAIFTVGVAIQTATVTSVPQISIGRFIAGLGVGAMSAIVPLYNGESAPKAIRGTLLVMYQLQIIMGCGLSYDYARYNVTDLLCPQNLLVVHYRPWDAHHRRFSELEDPSGPANGLGFNLAFRHLFLA